MGPLDQQQFRDWGYRVQLGPESNRPGRTRAAPAGFLISCRPQCCDSVFSWTWERSELERDLEVIWLSVLLPQMSKLRPESHLSGVAQ